MLYKTIKACLRPRAVLVFLILLLAYGQTLQMYFWQDDSALIFKLQNPGPEAGSFGAGVIGNGPYKYLVTPFVPFFPLLGKEPFGYFLIGFLLLVPVTYLFYLFSKEIFKDIKAAYFATLIFASGYVGSEIMFRIINSWQSNIGLILALLGFYFFTKHLNFKKHKYWVAAIIFYWAATQFVYVRSHSLVFVFLGIDLIFTLFPFKLVNFIKIILRQTPFVLIFYWKYISDGTAGSSSIGGFLGRLMSGQYELSLAFFANFANGLVHTPLQEKLITIFPGHYFFASAVILLFFAWVLSRSFLLSIFSIAIAYWVNNYFIGLKLFWYSKPKEILSGFLGIFLFIFVSFCGIKLLKKKNTLYRSLLVGNLIVVTQIFSYAIQFDYPPAIFDTAHRYFNYSMIGFALFYGGITFYLYKKHKSIFRYLPLFVILILNLYLGVTYQREIVVNRSQPSREFYQQLLVYTPQIPKGAVMFFDVEGEHVYQQQFRDFFSVGSMPEETALAIYYNLDRTEIRMLTSYDELFFYLANNPEYIDKTYSYVYGQDGLLNKTSNLRSNLTQEHSWQDAQILGQNKFKIKESQLSTAIELELKINKKTKSNLTFPSRVNDKQKLTTAQKLQILDYFTQRDEYYSEVSTESESEWKYQEVNYSVDKDSQTSWRGHRIYWNDNEHESLTLTLENPMVVSRILWRNWNHTLTPTSYIWETSLDKVNWIKVGQVENGPVRDDNELVTEDVDNTLAKYVKLSVLHTATNDAPAITEVELVPDKFDSLNLETARAYIDDPFANLNSQEEFTQIAPLAMKYSYINLTAESSYGDKQEFYLPITNLGQGDYQIYVLPKDINISKFTIALEEKYPFTVTLENVKYKLLNLSEMKQLNLLKNFSKN